MYIYTYTHYSTCTYIHIHTTVHVHIHTLQYMYNIYTHYSTCRYTHTTVNPGKVTSCYKITEQAHPLTSIRITD